MITKYSKELNEYLTRNFTTSEFHCKCKRKDCTTTLIDEALVTKLQKLRDEVGFPISINSAYRCEEHNKAIGGSPSSQHLLGKAVDIRPSRYPLSRVKDRILKEAEKLFNGIGIYSTFIHVDTRDKKARWFG